MFLFMPTNTFSLLLDLSGAHLVGKCSVLWSGYVDIHVCRLMRRRIKVADPRIYIHIREEVVDEYDYEHTVRNVPGVRVVPDY